MKVLLVSTSSGSRGGGELSLLYLGRALRARGHEVLLWMSRHERMDELAAKFGSVGLVVRSEYQNTYDRRTRSFGAWLDGGTARRVAKEWRDIGADIIHLNKQNLEDGLDLLAAARLTRTPAVAMIHITQSASYLRAEFAELRDAIARTALRRFRGLLVTTPGSRERELRAFLRDPVNVCTVPNGVPIPGVDLLSDARAAKRRELSVADGELLILAVGRMVPQKRPLLFLEIAARMRAKIPNARFIWVGDGATSAAWDEFVAQHDLGEFVQRLPWQHEVTPLLAAADVFMHVAEFEGLAFAILEAMAAGVPCAIAPNLLTEMPFLNTETAIAIDDADTWMNILTARQKLEAIGRAGRRVAEENFSYESMAACYEAVYLAELEKMK